MTRTFAPDDKAAAPRAAPARTRHKGGVSETAPHDSALRHVDGGAKYIDDMSVPAGCLHLALVTSPWAHARITAIDSSRALVPAGPAYQPLSADDGRERIHVPVASAPQLTVALSAAARLVLHAASGGGHGGFAAGATGGSGGSESRGRISPAAATAASDSYRRHGGLPTPGIQSGRIFRVSI